MRRSTTKSAKSTKPVGFADIVERVKPSVISVKVNINEKVAKDDSSNNDDSPFQPGSPMERFFSASADLTACPRACAVDRAAAVAR